MFFKKKTNSEALDISQIVDFSLVISPCCIRGVEVRVIAGLGGELDTSGDGDCGIDSLREHIKGGIKVLARLKSEIVELFVAIPEAVRQILDIQPLVTRSLGRSHGVDTHSSDRSFNRIVGLVPPDGPDEDVDEDANHASIVQKCQALILDPHNLKPPHKKKNVISFFSYLNDQKK